MNQLEIRFNSRVLMMKTAVTVLLPACPPQEAPHVYFEARKKLPVLWLLHGATCDAQDFLLQDDLLKSLRGHELMVVMPSGLNSDYADHMEFAGGYPFATHFFTELMPFIRNSLPASSAPSDQWIAGYSMGGAGALMLGLMHPEAFAGIAPLGASPRPSDFFTVLSCMTGEAFRQRALADPKAFPTEYGDPSDGITRKEINMIARYDTVGDYLRSPECTGLRLDEAIQRGSLPEVYFCCGDQDSCSKSVLETVARTKDAGCRQISCDLLPGVDHLTGCGKTIAKMIEHFSL